MPATQQQIENLTGELDALSTTIQTKKGELIEVYEALTEADDALELMRSQMMSEVLDERFEINNKLKYTNDEQRKIALIEKQQSNQDYLAMKNARQNLRGKRTTLEAEIEAAQNSHKAKLLVLQYYANLS